MSPDDPLPEIWGPMKEAGATPLSGGGQQPRVLQTRMVRAFKNYGVARSAWAHLVVPALFAVPRLVFFLHKYMFFPVSRVVFGAALL